MHNGRCKMQMHFNSVDCSLTVDTPHGVKQCSSYDPILLTLSSCIDTAYLSGQSGPAFLLGLFTRDNFSNCTTSLAHRTRPLSDLLRSAVIDTILAS